MSSLEEARVLAAHLEDVVEARQLDAAENSLAWATLALVHSVNKEGVRIDEVLTNVIWSIFAAHPELIHTIDRIDPTIDLSIMNWATVIKLFVAFEIRLDEMKNVSTV